MNFSYGFCTKRNPARMIFIFPSSMSSLSRFSVDWVFPPEIDTMKSPRERKENLIHEEISVHTRSAEEEN